MLQNPLAGKQTEDGIADPCLLAKCFHFAFAQAAPEILRSHALAAAKHLLTSPQFTTFHQAAM